MNRREFLALLAAVPLAVMPKERPLEVDGYQPRLHWESINQDGSSVRYEFPNIEMSEDCFKRLHLGDWRFVKDGSVLTIPFEEVYR